jgi:hypothetical protein
MRLALSKREEGRNQEEKGVYMPDAGLEEETTSWFGWRDVQGRQRV